MAIYCRVSNVVYTSTTNLNCSQRIHWYNSLVLQRLFSIIRCEFLKFVVLVISSLKSDRFLKPVRFIPLILLINGRCSIPSPIDGCFVHCAKRISRNLSNIGVSGNRTSFPKQQILALAKVLVAYPTF